MRKLHCQCRGICFLNEPTLFFLTFSFQNSNEPICYNVKKNRIEEISKVAKIKETLPWTMKIITTSLSKCLMTGTFCPWASSAWPPGLGMLLTWVRIFFSPLVATKWEKNILVCSVCIFLEGSVFTFQFYHSKIEK